MASLVQLMAEAETETEAEAEVQGYDGHVLHSSRHPVADHKTEEEIYSQDVQVDWCEGTPCYYHYYLDHSPRHC